MIQSFARGGGWLYERSEYARCGTGVRSHRNGGASPATRKDTRIRRSMGRLYINQRKDEKRANLNIQPVGSAVPLLPQRLPLAAENGRCRGKKFRRLSRNVTFARVLTDSIRSALVSDAIDSS